jgi:hypothetical protein
VKQKKKEEAGKIMGTERLRAKKLWENPLHSTDSKQNNHMANTTITPGIGSLGWRR